MSCFVFCVLCFPEVFVFAVLMPYATISYAIYHTSHLTARSSQRPIQTRSIEIRRCGEAMLGLSLGLGLGLGL